MKVNTIECKRCHTLIYSRCKHDFHRCRCGAIAVDGGFDYFKLCGDKKDMLIARIEIKATREQLYDDWNKNINKYGTIQK